MGQFIDHTIGLRDQSPTDPEPLEFDSADSLELFVNDLGEIAFSRTAAAPATGVRTPREQLNMVSAYIDGWVVYGGTTERLEWLRAGPVDGLLENNLALLFTGPNDYLPRADARPDVPGPEMELVGRLLLDPSRRAIAGDVRANENIALTAVHTLFVREHNRIVNALPAELSEERKFQIARRVVGAALQFITYNEFLPALGVELRPYRGYRQEVDASVSNEFAVVGYRAHSMVHGEVEVEASVDAFEPGVLGVLEDRGVEVELEGDEVALAVPLNIAFANPDLVELIGLGHILAGLAGEGQYKNDEQIDNQLRSVLFQIPKPDADVFAGCLDGTTLDECFSVVLDLGAVDIARARDHGIPYYNDLRAAYGLPRLQTFIEVTGEASDSFDGAVDVDPGHPLDDPDILTFDKLLDIDGNEIALDSEAAEGEAVTGIRRTSLAARLKHIYDTTDQIEAFVGMVAEEHVPGSEFGPLQLQIWKRQFEALRDGDRFYYENDPWVRRIERQYDVTYRHSLAELIALNTDIERTDLPQDVFLLR